MGFRMNAFQHESSSWHRLGVLVVCMTKAVASSHTCESQMVKAPHSVIGSR